MKTCRWNYIFCVSRNHRGNVILFGGKIIFRKDFILFYFSRTSPAYICIYYNKYIHIIYICMYICIHMYTIYMYCIYVCVYVCIVYMYIYILYTYVYICTYTLYIYILCVYIYIFGSVLQSVFYKLVVGVEHVSRF